MSSGPYRCLCAITYYKTKRSPLQSLGPRCSWEFSAPLTVFGNLCFDALVAILFCYRRLAPVGSADRENSSTDIFLLACLIPTVTGTRAIQECHRLPTYGSSHADAIRMWTSVASESEERQPTEDSSPPMCTTEDGSLMVVSTYR